MGGDRVSGLNDGRASGERRMCFGKKVNCGEFAIIRNWGNLGSRIVGVQVSVARMPNQGTNDDNIKWLLNFIRLHHHDRQNVNYFAKCLHRRRADVGPGGLYEPAGIPGRAMARLSRT